MWENLPKKQKEKYKRLILAYASLTEMFAQKSLDEDNDVAPIINSKYQETAFQKAFEAQAEDIGNTSYDVSLQYNGEKYLVGIKTFGISSGDQKIAQFKAKHDAWAKIIEKIKKNADGIEDKNVIDSLNEDLYMELARKIARIRNARIDSSRANIRGFIVKKSDSHIHSVYHVLMPSDKKDKPQIFVGETSYDKIDIENLHIIGCTGKRNPTNFFFTDKKHIYKYTAADSQLHMNFNNRDIICDKWDVEYAENAYRIFVKIADVVYPREENKYEIENVSLFNLKDEKEIEETYCWTIWNKNKEVEAYSGFNSFFGTGSKMGKNQREQRIDKLCKKYKDEVKTNILDDVKNCMMKFLLVQTSSSIEREQKVRLREYLIKFVNELGNENFSKDITKLLYRPMDEMYIPIPESANFHKVHPNFFGKGYGETVAGTSKLMLPKENRRFNLVFEPSGDVLPAYIAQDNGKAIESAEKQTYLGEWILKGVFQLKEYEPLTSNRLEELNINGVRLTKYKGSADIHLEFIWIDEDNPPQGYIPRK